MLGVIGNKFSIGKETYAPFAAELHYFRIDKRYWSICFERIKRAGFRIISTAVPWNIHQDDRKHFDFAGLTDPRKDLVVFLELAREFGFKVILRPGPWVAGQLPNGGLPKFVLSDLDFFARDAAGQELKLEDDHGIEGGYLPSYLHKNYQFHLRSFFKAFIEITKNYVHPRGPVFMVELDYETSYGRQLNPASADYNPDVVARHYPEYLEEKYSDVKKLNAAYKERNSDFTSVEPPRKFDKIEAKSYQKAIDWMGFREHILREYLEMLESIFQSYTVEPLVFRSLYFRPGDLIPAFNLVPEDRSPFLGANVFPGAGNYFDLSVKARFLQAEYGFAFAASFVSGAASVASRPDKDTSPVTNNARRFYMAASLSAGFKGFNHYMFVDREHWYGAPLHRDGTISEGYEVVSRFNQAVTELGLENMESSSPVAVVANRHYYWLREIANPKLFDYIPRLLDESSVGFARDMMRLKLGFGVRENRNWESMSKYKLLFIASAEVMSKRDQEAIVELVKGGTTVILCGLMPRYDENLKNCQVLANHFRIRTTADYRIATVDHKNDGFPCYTYGVIRTTDEGKIKTLCKAGSKVVGVCSSRYAANLYLFAFDVASGGNHKKLAFIESTLETEKISSFLYCSDPSVDISFQIDGKRGLLYVVAPPAGELSDGYEGDQKDIIVKADLKAAGLKGTKLRLTNVFDDEEAKPIRTTAKELKDGIALKINFPDGYLFLVEKY